MKNIKAVFVLLVLPINFLFSYDIIDVNNRTLYDHEQRGGHTIARHINKSFSYLRNRCRKNKKMPLATTFYDLKETQDILKNMLRDNRKLIDKSKGKTARVVIDNKEDWYIRWGDYGKGIDCKVVGQKKRMTPKFKNPWLLVAYLLANEYIAPISIDEIQRLNDAKAVLVFNKEDWYILTAYPYTRFKETENSYYLFNK